MVEAHSVRSSNPNPLAGAAVGAAAGLVGSWMMIRFQHAVGGGNGNSSTDGQSAPRARGDSHPHRRRDALPNDTDGTYADEPATMQAASTLSEALTGRSLDERQKEIAGPVLHYAFGALIGALYGAGAELRPSTTAGFGLPFGASIWLAADEVGIALAGFATEPTDYPASRHAAALGSHLVFGATVEAVRRAIRGNRGRRRT
jgi:putative membrane protein